MQLNVRKSIKAGRLIYQNPSSPVLFDELSGEYLVLVPISALMVIFLFSLDRLNKDGSPLTHFILPLLALLGLTGFFWFTYLKVKTNRKLIRIDTGVDRDANRDLSLQVIELMGWTVMENRKAYATAIGGNVGITWGQEITVVYDQGAVHLNCRNRTGGIPSARSPYLFGKCDQCVKRFNEELERLLDRSREPVLTSDGAVAGSCQKSTL